MINRAKVIKEFELFIKEFHPACTSEGVELDMFREVLALLKEQEPKKVEWRIGRAHCPSCGELFPRKKETQHIRFCNFCGQEVECDEKL